MTKAGDIKMKNLTDDEITKLARTNLKIGGYNMQKRDKYSLTNHLKNKTVSSILISFNEFEKQKWGTLPESWYKYRAFWSNIHTEPVDFVWLEEGYKTISVDFENLQVTFERVRWELVC